jgi:hypothetical protein
MSFTRAGDLLGAWRLDSAVEVFDDGERRDEFGPSSRSPPPTRARVRRPARALRPIGWMFVIDLFAAVPVIPLALFALATARTVSLAVTFELLVSPSVRRAGSGILPTTAGRWHRHDHGRSRPAVGKLIS